MSTSNYTTVIEYPHNINSFTKADELCRSQTLRRLRYTHNDLNTSQNESCIMIIYSTKFTMYVSHNWKVCNCTQNNLKWESTLRVQTSANADHACWCQRLSNIWISRHGFAHYITCQ